MTRFLAGTRYLVILPIIGLAIAASFFFIFGGIALIRLLLNVLLVGLGLSQNVAELEQGIVIYEVVEYVHTFLIGTVLYITAAGLYQLFIHKINFPEWLRIDGTEELETNLIGVTVVVLAVNFMGAIFAGGPDNLLTYGGGMALVIASLGLFVGLRAWSLKLKRGSSTEEASRLADDRSEEEGER